MKFFAGIVCCYGFLPDKRRQTYERFFTIVRNTITQHHGDQGSLHTFVFDFEMASHVAARTAFSNIMTKGCTFHFAQTLKRKIKNIGLSPWYSEKMDWIAAIVSYASC